MSEKLAQLEKKGGGGSGSFKSLDDIVFTFPASWAGRTDSETIDVSSAKQLLVGKVNVAAGASQTWSFDIKDNNGNTLFSQGNTTAASYSNGLGLFDVSNASAVTFNVSTNYNATFTFSQLGLIS